MTTIRLPDSRLTIGCEMIGTPLPAMDCRNHSRSATELTGVGSGGADATTLPSSLPTLMD
jgi:hypothetical protein